MAPTKSGTYRTSEWTVKNRWAQHTEQDERGKRPSLGRVIESRPNSDLLLGQSSEDPLTPRSWSTSIFSLGTSLVAIVQIISSEIES